MKHQELNWRTHDNIEIFAQVWEPPVVAPRAIVCLVHGLGDHSSRFAHVAEAFGKEGFVLFAFDQRGHGRSGGARGHFSSADDFMNDIDLLLEQARSQYPGLPLILYGHSLGGIFVLHHSLKRKPNVKGVIVTGPALHSSLEKQPVKVLMAKILGAISPTTTLASGLDPGAISRDPAVVQAYIEDPLAHDKATLGFGKLVLGVNKWTLENAANFPQPLLLMHGKLDAIAFPSSSTEFAAALKDRCTLVLWDGMYHEIHNEPEKIEVFKTMMLWMDARLRE
jgi:alpha-beta hydrolase superfamily lysophospholipase